MNSVHEYVAVNSGEPTNPNTLKQPKDLAFVSVDEAKTSPFSPSRGCYKASKVEHCLARPAPASMNQDEAVKETFNGRANSS